MLPFLHTTIANTLYGPGKLPPEVELAFEQPTLRQTSMQTLRGGDGRATQRLPPRRFDLHYMVSAASSVPADEHRLLWHALAALLKYAPLPLAGAPGALVAALLRRDQPLPPALTTPTLRALLAAEQPLPEPVLQELRAALEEFTIPLAARVGRLADGPRAADLWGALDLPPRPAIFYTVTMPVDLEIAFETPLVLAGPTRRFTRPDAADTARGLGIIRDRAVAAGTATSIGGVVRDRNGAPLPDVLVRAEGRAVEARTDDHGRYQLDRLQPEPVTLWAQRPGEEPTAFSLHIPADSYDLVLD